MKRLVLCGVMACTGLIVSGCRGGSMMSGGNGGAGGTGGAGGGTGGVGGNDMATGGTVKNYMPSSVTAMRNGKPGDYQLDGVVSIGITPSTKSPKIFVQDAAGGDFSAIMGKCSTTSPTHPCTAATAATIAGLANGKVLTVKGTYIKKAGFEEFYVDSVVDTKTSATVPAAQAVTLADVQRSANNPKWWFERVTVDLGGVTLKGFDWSPLEFKYTGGTGCPSMFGWGMVPSTSTATAGGACPATTQPTSAIPAMGAAPADEILIGTDFYKDYKYSSDCVCATKYSDTPVTAANTLSGPISGILIGETPYMSSTVYQYLAPQAMADATLK